MEYNGLTRYPCSVESVAESPCELLRLTSVHRSEATYGSIGAHSPAQKAQVPP